MRLVIRFFRMEKLTQEAADTLLREYMCIRIRGLK